MSETTLAGQLALAQSEMSNPALNQTNGHFGSKYADLAACRNAVIPTLGKHGIGCVQIPGTSDDGKSVTLTTILVHGSERMDCGTLSLPMSGGRGNPAHVMGSALTYLRRYALCAVAGVAGDADDDGNGMAGAEPPKRRTPTKGPPPRPRDVFMDLDAALADKFGPTPNKAADDFAKQAGHDLSGVFGKRDETAARALLDALEGER